MPSDSYIPGWANVVSANNSFSTGATSHTGTYENIPLPWLLVTCLSDTAGTITISLSHDGTNVHSTITRAVSANSGKFVPLLKGARYVKVDWSSSGTPSSFSLQTSYGLYDPGVFSIDGVIPADAGATLTMALDGELLVSASRFQGQYPVQKFGRAPDGVQTSSTDIWDRADSVPTQQTWLAPTAARVHTIVSSSANDASAGTGMRTMRVWGLQDWDSKESSEDITMNGITGVNTVNSYVIIHRMRGLTFGSGGQNAGTITATAATDATITAVIRPGVGSTAMAIYGWPSTQTLYLKSWKCAINKASGSAAHILYQLFRNPEPDTNSASFVEVDVTGRQSNGNSSDTEPYKPYLPLPGPGILKVSGIGSAADLDGTAGFAGILVDN